MGMGSSMIQEEYFEDYLGMRYESVDMTELVRRMEEEIYDNQEFDLAIKWVEKYCKEGEDINPEEIQFSREKKDENWETVVKMTMIIRDLMVGNPRSEERRVGKEWRSRSETKH